LNNKVHEKNSSRQDLKSSGTLPLIKTPHSTRLPNDSLGRTGLSKALTPKELKALELSQKLEKYNMIHTMAQERARQQMMEEEMKLKTIRDENRRIHLEKMHKNMEYVRELDRIGWERWKKTQDDERLRIQKEKEFADKMTEKLKQAYLAKVEADKEDAVGGLAEFELTAQKNGIELEHDPEEVKKVEKAQTSVNAIMIKIKEKTLQAEHARKEREKRKRKVLVEQMRAQKEIEEKKTEEGLLQKFREASIRVFLLSIGSNLLRKMR